MKRSPSSILAAICLSLCVYEPKLSAEFFGPYPFADRPDYGYISTLFTGVSADGQKIVGYTSDDLNPSIYQGCLLQNGNFTTLNGPNGLALQPWGISGDGSTIFGNYINSNRVLTGFILKNGNFTSLNGPNGEFASPQGVSTDGTTIVGNYSNRGFLYRDGIFTDFIYPDSTSTRLYGISGDGSTLLVASADVDGVDVGYVYKNQNFTTIGYGDPTDASADGRVVLQQQQIFYSSDPVPEPSTYALFGIGATGMLMVLQRKKAA
jgi:uncharacterized membrane protein